MLFGKICYDRTEYEYDAFNRNTKAETFDGNVQVNHYDAEGLRYEMEENGEQLASNAEYARAYYHYASDEMGSITHVVTGNGEEDLVVTGQGGEPALTGQGNGTAEGRWDPPGGSVLICL